MPAAFPRRQALGRLVCAEARKTWGGGLFRTEFCQKIQKTHYFGDLKFRAPCGCLDLRRAVFELGGARAALAWAAQAPQPLKNGIFGFLTKLLGGRNQFSRAHCLCAAARAEPQREPFLSWAACLPLPARPDKGTRPPRRPCRSQQRTGPVPCLHGRLQRTTRPA